MNPMLYAIPVFMASILFEAWMARRRAPGAYDIPDAITSLHFGILSQVWGAFTRVIGFGIYALAFEDRTLHPESLVEDVPVRFKDWLPRNFDHEHQGAVTVRRALQQSLNVPAVLALEKVGPDRFLKTLRTAGAEPGVAKDETRASLEIGRAHV